MIKGVLNDRNNIFLPMYYALFFLGTSKYIFQPNHSSEIKSLGYKNLAIGEKHVNGGGDIRLVCKLKIVKDDSSNHSLSSDLKALINDEKSADVVVEAGGKEFKVHR